MIEKNASGQSEGRSHYSDVLFLVFLNIHDDDITCRVFSLSTSETVQSGSFTSSLPFPMFLKGEYNFTECAVGLISP